MNRFPTAWQQFFNSRFRYRPTKNWKNGRPFYKTNTRHWAKQ